MNWKTIQDKFRTLFKQGLSPRQLCESIIVASVFAIIPILGVSTFLLTYLSFKRKLNLPIMMAISYLMWPVQIALIIPFIRIGEFIFSVPPSRYTVEEIIVSFQESFFQTLGHFFFELLCGLGAWMVTTIPFSIGIYLVFLIFLNLKKKKNSP